MEGAVDRKTFLRRAATGLVIPSSVAGLVAACTDAPSHEVIGPTLGVAGNLGQDNGGYGALDNDQGILLLPSGFQVRAFGATGDRMSDGRPTPVAHDGMAAFPFGPDRVRLVRNHEDRNGVTTPIASPAY